MAPADTLEQHQHEVCNAFARAAVAMRDAANTAENFSNWFSRVNNLQNVPMPPVFNSGLFNFLPNFGGTQHQQANQPPSPEQTGKKRKGAEDGDGKKKRKERKPRDANAPKRPPSPYLLFQNEIRKQIQAKHPDITYGQVLTEIAKMWKEMSPEEKAPYQASQAVLKAKYEQEKADYEVKPVDTATPGEPAQTAPSKVPTAATAVSKSAAKETSASDASSDESSESSSSDDDNDEEEEAEPIPEPPRKKSKKEAPRLPTPPPAKSDKKKEKSEGKKKKKVAET